MSRVTDPPVRGTEWVGGRQSSSRVRAAFGRPLAVACVVLAGYLGWSAYYLHYHSIESVAHVGSQFQGRGHGSAAIDRLAGFPTEAVGYDGQFYYFVALDPAGARSYLDNATYRYSRPVYPLAARALALGQAGAVPWALLLLGFAGVAAGTFACAAILKSEGFSAWYGALYGLYPGLFVAVTWDLAESLAYGLTACALLAWRRDDGRLLPAALLFGVAGATRESTLLFPIALAIRLAASRQALRAAALAGISLAPYLATKVALALWLHGAGAANATHFEPLPFLGLIRQWPWASIHVQQGLAVVIPALVATGLAWAAIRSWTPALCALVANVLVLVVFLPRFSYVDYLASGRIATGVVLAFMPCLPSLLHRGWVAQVWIVAALWLLPWYTFLPDSLAR